MNPSEADIQRTIVHALMRDGWLILRVNQGARHEDDRYVSFARWTTQDHGTQDSGIADLLAVKPGRRPLAIECKAPGKERNVSEAQLLFLNAWVQGGGEAVVASSLEDLAEFLDRVVVQ